MGKGLGIAALVFSILAIFVPGVTMYVVILAMVLATIAGLLGEKGLTISSLVISVVNIIFLSPLTWAAIAGENLHGGSSIKWLIAIAFIAPIVGLVVGSAKSQAHPDLKSDATASTSLRPMAGAQSAISNAAFCPECGTSVEPKASFCGECGFKL